MKIFFVLDDPPYDTEQFYEALKFARNPFWLSEIKACGDRPVIVVRLRFTIGA
ncbi:MAG: hypothetical protein HY245_13300 [Rhizobiales bacterium]|nr:hypothetical protein [Hyphomicrobiales bacterium]MBI3674367.1 hypothetical protein [Hyphomicrobiales bacterium]